MLYVTCVSAAALLQLVSALPHFQQLIPNGAKVPDPCKNDSSIWPTVGHFAPPAGWEDMDDVEVTLNPFGADFSKSGYEWTTDLCRKDSDGDGKTNGQELGDPNCTWVAPVCDDDCEGDDIHEEERPSTAARITHPGFCEPVTDDACKRKNKLLNATNCQALARLTSTTTTTTTTTTTRRH